MSEMDRRGCHVLDLNDDCLGHVFAQLNLRACEQVRQVCQRFEEIVCRHCCSKYKICCWPESSALNFKWLATYMSEVVEQLELRTTRCEDFGLLAKRRFKKCKSLAINVRAPIGDAVSPTYTQRTRIVVNAFPALRRLLIDGAEGLNALLALAELSELSLCFYVYDDIAHFPQLFRRLRLRQLNIAYPKSHMFPKEEFSSLTRDCPTLEEIALHGDLMNIILSRLRELPLLRKIAYTHDPLDSYFHSVYFYFIYFALSDNFASRILTLHSAELFEALPLDHFNGLHNLRTLIVGDKFMYCFEPRGIQCDLQHLRELHFCRDDCRFLVMNEDEAIYDDDGNVNYTADFDPSTILESCHNLTLLALPWQWLDDKFRLDKLGRLLAQQERRHDVLEVRCLVDGEESLAKAQEMLPRLSEAQSAVLRLSLAVRPMEPLQWGRLNNYSFEIILDVRLL